MSDVIKHCSHATKTQYAALLNIAFFYGFPLHAQTVQADMQYPTCAPFQLNPYCSILFAIALRSAPIHHRRLAWIFIRLPSGVLKIVTTTATGAKIPYGLNVNTSGMAGRRVSWREIPQ